MQEDQVIRESGRRISDNQDIRKSGIGGISKPDALIS
jgi:hypothetical protein